MLVYEKIYQNDKVQDLINFLKKNIDKSSNETIIKRLKEFI